MIGELIDHYRVLELVGCGAMGVVYKGLDVNLDRPVAIKVLGAAARNDPDFVERFRLEARLQAALTHPNVAVLFDYFVHDDAPVAVMEFIDGESLEQLVRRRGPIPAHEAMPLFKQALLGVAAAHRGGIVHRDLKPSNLMIAKDGIVKVMDFGIAKRQGAPGATKVSSSTSIGSPLYMAPEQILGRPVDCRTDVYALGVTLYELLSGQKPFNPRGKTEYSVLNAHVNELPEPPTVHCRDIPGPVVDAVLRALAKEPEVRFQSADEFMAALPDVPAPNTAAPQAAASNAAAPRVGPTGTVALAKSTPVGEGPSATGRSGGTMVFEYASGTRRDPHDSMAFEYSAATLRQESSTHRSAPSSAAAAPPAVPVRIAPPATPVIARPSDNPPQGLRLLLRAYGAAAAAVIVATLVLVTVLQHAGRLDAILPGASSASSGPFFTHEPASAAAPAPPTSTEAAAPPPADVTAATELTAAAMPTIATPLTKPTAPASPDLSGTWRGDYVDASGRRLLHIVSLSISRVRYDGGVEGTLHYQAASGDGECKLHPRRSTYSASEQRLQLSPEGCSPHYPKELGVPLDFDGVSPQANTLRDGRIEAPTGELIRVKLQRVSGV